MFQGMFRKRGRPPESPLQIRGYDEPNQNESIQIPGHQLRNAPRLPLPAVREVDQIEVAEQEQPEFNQAIVESSSVQQRQIDVDMLDSHNQRLIPNNPQVMSPNQVTSNMSSEVDTFNVPNLPFSHEQRDEIFSETSSRMYRELCGSDGMVLQQNNILQQVIHKIHHDSNLHGTINEQQENIGQIIKEMYRRLQQELMKLKLTLRQGFLLIDETCAKHSSALEGLQSFAGAEIGASQRVHEALQGLSCQLGNLQRRTLELERNTSLDWRMQAIEDDLNRLQVKFSKRCSA